MIPRNVLPALLAIALFGLGMPRIADAGNTKPRATPPRHHTVIESVSSDSITITQADGSHTYKIDANTEITFKGQTTTADQLQAGMRVQVNPDAADQNLAAQISADDAPKDPTPKPKK